MTVLPTPFSNRIFTDSDQKPVVYDGSPVTWRVSAYVIVLQAGQVLLIKDSQEELYDIVGGGIELGENLTEGLAREAMEEAGAKVRLGRLLHAELDWFYHKREKAYYQTLQLYYLAELEGELTTPTEEKIAWRGFVPVTELQKKYQVPPVAAQVIADLI